MRRTTVLILTILTCMQSVHGQNENDPAPFEVSDFGWNETQEPDRNVTQAWNLTEVSAAMTSAPIAAQMLYERLARRPNATEAEIIQDILTFLEEAQQTIWKLVSDSQGGLCILGKSGFSIDLSSKPGTIVANLQREINNGKGINIPVVPSRDRQDEGTARFQVLSIQVGSCNSGGDSKIPASVTTSSDASIGVSFDVGNHTTTSITIGNAKEWSRWASGN